MNGTAEDLAYLQAELARIDILIQHEVQRWQAAGQNLDDNFRGLYVTDADANTLLESPFATSWGQNLAPGTPES